MSNFESQLQHRLDAIQKQGLSRSLRRVDSAQSTRIAFAGKTFLNFSSNDYLGLANHPALKRAAVLATEQFGAGAGASRLICGSVAPHHDLESALATFKSAPAALAFSSGYAAALGTLCALLTSNDLVIVDKRVHACIVDAARLSGAKLRVFAHNNLDDLENILKWAEARHATSGQQANTLIVTESVFSMDGDQAPLPQLIDLKNKYGAWLMVDEAHATGVCGPTGKGLAEQCPAGSIEIQMWTLGKALGSSGGYICGAQSLIDLLVNTARPFIFSTAPVPAAAAAATAAIQLLQSADGPNRRARLWKNVTDLQAKLGMPGSPPTGAIIPIVLGLESEAIRAADHLRSKGIFIPAIRYPTVPRGSARLRVTLTAEHTAADIDELASALQPLTLRSPSLAAQP